jgi:hypothetical protein
MTARAHEHRLWVLQRGRRFRIERIGLLNWAIAAALAAPLALLWAGGVLLYAGVVYAAFYATMMAVPTGLNVLSMFDAVRVLTGRPSTFMPWMLALCRVGLNEQRAGRLPAPSGFTKLVVLGNPLANLMLECWAVALRYRPTVWQQIQDDACRLASQLERTRPPQFVVFEAREWSREFPNNAVAC